MQDSRTRTERLRSAALWWVGIALAIIVWHVAARSQPAYVLPGPQATWEALLDLARSGRLGGALLLTIERGATPEILKAARKIAALHNDLQAAITAHPECFVRPRTMVVDGLKFGLQKQKGRISWEDDRALCERIMKLTESGAIEPQQAETLIEYRPRPVAAALEQLDAKTLKRLGVTVTLDSDAPLIKTVDSDIEKIVTQMVKQATRNLDGGQA